MSYLNQFLQGRKSAWDRFVYERSFLSLLAISAGLTAATLLIVSYSVQKRFRETIREDLCNSVDTYQSFDKQQEDTLKTSAALLANLPNVRALMTTEDAATIRDASADVRKLSGSDLLVLANRAGIVAALQTRSDGLKRNTAQGLRRPSYLPQATGFVPKPETQEKLSPVPQGSETILLSDEAAVRELACQFLRMKGYTALEMQGGEEALDVARRHTGIIHLVLTDMVMPKMNGGQLAVRLKAIRPETRAAFMSGYSEFSEETWGRVFRSARSPKALFSGLLGQNRSHGPELKNWKRRHPGRLSTALHRCPRNSAYRSCGRK